MDKTSSRIVFWAVTGVMMALIAFARYARAPHDEKTGVFSFRYSTLFRGLAYLTLLLPPTLVWIAVFVKPPKDAAETLIFGGLILGFAFGGIFLVWETRHFFLGASDAGLDCRSPWRSARFLNWNEVWKLSYSKMNSTFDVHAVDGWKFRTSMFVADLNQFLELCERHLTLEQLEQAKAGYGVVRRQFPSASGPTIAPPPAR